MKVTPCLSAGHGPAVPGVPTVAPFRNESLRVGKGDNLTVTGWYCEQTSRSHTLSGLCPPPLLAWLIWMCCAVLQTWALMTHASRRFLPAPTLV